MPAMRTRLLLRALERRLAPAVFTVNSLGDTGAGSGAAGDLRYCVTQANAAAGVDSITFDPAVFASASTITLDLGELPVTDGVTVVGPGAGLLTLKAGPASRHVNVNEPNGVSTVTLSGMRLIDGNTTGRGGAIRLESTDDKVTLTEMVFENNKAVDFGGTVGVENGSGVLTHLTVSRCVFRGNSTGNWGGAIFLGANTASGAVTHGNTVRLIDSAFENNTANGHDGVMTVMMLGKVVGGTAFIEGCLFANNTSVTADGGALGFRNTPSGDVTIRNSTFSGNKALDPANGRGGALRTASGYNGTVSVQNSTFTLNQSRVGGAYARTAGAATMLLESCIVFDNTAAVSGPNFSGATVTAKNCIISSTTGVSSFTDLGGNQIGPAADALLAPLADNGGLTKTHGLRPGSPAVDKGSNPEGLSFDQRGAGFPRVLGAAADVGAFEGTVTAYALLAPLGPVVAPGATPDAVQVIYADDSGIDVSTIDTADIEVVDPKSKPLSIINVSVTPGGNGSPRTATYRFAVPVNAAAGWDASDNGFYSVSLASGQVFNVAGNALAPSTLGTFDVLVPVVYVVDEVSDLIDGDVSAGHVSLREAVGLANADGNPSTIVFDPAVFATAQSIFFTGGQLSVTATVDIQGPDAGVTLNAGGTSRIFYVDIPGVGSFSASNLTLTNGSGAGAGGAILMVDDNLNLARCTVSNSKATTKGGAIANSVSGATGGWTITDTAVSGNSAPFGGALYFRSGQTLALAGVTVSGTTTTGSGDTSAVFIYEGTAVLTNSTFSGNKSASRGGAIAFYSSAKVTVRNCTITENDSAIAGGGIHPFGGSLTLTSTVVAGNTVAGSLAAGADLFTQSSVTIAGDNNLIGILDPADNVALAGVGNFTGSLNVPLFAELGPLADNGGPTLTHGLLPGSPALDNGGNPAGLPTDQRGAGFPRVQGASADVGSFEGMLTTPNGVLAPVGPVSIAGPTPDSVQVMYHDDAGIDVSTIDPADILILDPQSKPLTVLGVTVTPAGNGSPRTATYTFAVPVNGAAGWDATDAGTYTVRQQAGQVFDVGGTAARADVIGVFQAAVPAVYVVDEVSDASDGIFGPGKLSVREAVQLANTDATPSSIVFDPSVFGSAATIVMSGGELLVSAALNIQGPAAGLTLDANKASRVFTTDVPGTSRQDIYLSGLTLTNGNAGSGFGAAILNTDEAVTLANVTITNCSAWRGTAVAILSAAGSLTVTDSILSGNASAQSSGGGAIFVGGASPVTLTRCTLSGNSAAGGGGAVWFFNAGGRLTLTDCTLTGNKASVMPVNSYGGGALYLKSTTATLLNCTLSGNQALVGGAILNSGGYGKLTLRNCTVAFNSATDAGGGLFSVSSAAVIESSIIGRNDAPFGSDVAGRANAAFSLFSSTVGAFITGSNNRLNVDPRLNPLGNNGGPTPTHRLAGGSPCLEAGSNPAGLTFDQRGPGFPRVLGAAPDIGAVEGASAIPAASAMSTDVSAPGATGQFMIVTYSDDAGIDVSSLGVGDVTVSGPNGFTAIPALVSIDVNANGTPRVATYLFTPPGGSWDVGDNGTYKVTLAAGQVQDTDLPLPNVVPAGLLTTFSVAIPTKFVVTNTNDWGPGSLRQAVTDANNLTGPDVIVFDSTAFATAKTITLTGGQITISGPVTITGPAARVTLDGVNASRIFYVDVPGQSGRAVEISGLILTRGFHGSDGGGIFNDDEALSLNSVTISDCASYFGAGVAVYSALGSLSITDSTLSGNTATGTVARGGAIFLNASSSVSLVRCTLSGNTSSFAGGAVFFYSAGGTLTVTDSLLSGNKALDLSLYASGGAMWLYETTATIRNSTLSGNAATTGGAIRSFGGTLTIESCTAAFNSAAVSGGAIYGDNATVTLHDSIIAKNSAPAGPDITGSVTAHFSLVGSTSGTAVSGANNVLNADPLLAPLADNGGSTKTHALLPGSPAVNAGNNSAGLAFDQRGPGFPRFSGKAPDIGAFEVQLPRTVIGVQVNAGAVQRSRVTSVAVTFDQPVMLPANPADAFQLKRQSDNAAVTLSASVAGNAVTLTFIGGPVEFGSLGDGRYTLTVIAAQVNGGVFDGNGDGTAGDDYVLVGTPGNGLFRLFGDADGDGDVDVVDWSAFRGAFGGTSNQAFDFDNDGDVDTADFGQFRGRFGAGV